jgi:hypothetical protein
VTDQEYKEFTQFGCASRCIIKAAEMLGSPISRDDFITRFSCHFPTDHFGLLSTDKICLILSTLDLCDSVHSARNSGVAMEAIAGKQPVLVLTDLKTDNAMNPTGRLSHCRLADNVKESPLRNLQALHLWEPFLDDTDAWDWVALERLERELVHYLIFGAMKGSTPSVRAEHASNLASGIGPNTSGNSAGL